jgi:glycosyltransferase involved in cell wall biosynthesis
MRVTHVITRLIVGGAQENTIATVLGLRQKPGLEVDLISGPTYGPEGSLLVEGRGSKAEGQHSGARLSALDPRLTIVPELVRPVHPLKDFIALRKLEKIFRATRPDLVHTHSGKAGILGRLAAARAGVPVIVHHIHGPSFGNFQGPLANLVFTAAERHAAKVTTHFVCSAGAMTRLYLAAGIGRPEMYTRVFSGFELKPFLDSPPDPDLRRSLGFAENHFVIGKIGRLFKLKGHADLLTAFARLLPQAPHSRLLFVGDGNLRGDLEAQVRALGLTGKVAFTGLVPPGEVPRYVGIMDCLAHLSWREALSRALPQALAAGKPVVAYDFDGADEICLDHQTGFLVRTGDTATAAEKLLLLANDPALRERLGRTGQRFVRENFTVERLVDEQYALYLRLVNGVRAPAQNNS